MLHQRRRGRVAGLRSSDLPAELDRAEATLDRLDEIVPTAIPFDRALLDDVRSELGDHRIGVDDRGQSNPGPVAAAVEVGGHEKLLVGERVVVGEPGARARAELELTRSPSRGQAIRVAEQQYRA